MAEPAVSRKTYLKTFLTLLGLTLLTTLFGFLDLGPLSTPVAIFFAIAKAGLIAAFFMHALHESTTVRVVIAAGVIWLLIFISLTAVDYISRPWSG